MGAPGNEETAFRSADKGSRYRFPALLHPISICQQQSFASTCEAPTDTAAKPADKDAVTQQTLKQRWRQREASVETLPHRSRLHEGTHSPASSCLEAPFKAFKSLRLSLSPGLLLSSSLVLLTPCFNGPSLSHPQGHSQSLWAASPAPGHSSCSQPGTFNWKHLQPSAGPALLHPHLQLSSCTMGTASEPKSPTKSPNQRDSFPNQRDSFPNNPALTQQEVVAL